MASLSVFYKVDTLEDFNSSFICESSNSDFFAIMYKNQVRVLHLNTSPCNLDNKLDLCNDLISPPAFYAMDVEEPFETDEKSLDHLSGLYSDLCLPHKISLKADLSPFIVQAKWSPKELAVNTSPLLCVMTSAGSVFLYFKDGIEWVMTENISLKIQLMYNENTTSSITGGCSGSITLNTLCTTAIAWTSCNEYNDTPASQLLTGQNDGTVFIWNVSVKRLLSDDVTNIQLSSMFISDIKSISLMMWIPLSRDFGFLILGSVSGESILYMMKYDSENKLTTANKKIIYSDKDRLAVSHLDYLICDHNTIIIITVKSTYVLVTVVKIATLNVTHFEYALFHSEITGCSWYQPYHLAVATRSDGMHILSIKFDEKSGLAIKKQNIQLTLNELCLTSLSISSNKAFWIYTTVPSVKSYKKNRYQNSIYFAWPENFEFLKNSLLRDSFTVYNTKDYLELFRLLVIRKRINLKMWVNKLLPIREQHLKLYMYILKLYLEVKESNKVDTKFDFKAEEVYKAKLQSDKCEIYDCLNSCILKCAVNRIRHYSRLLKNGKLTKCQSDALLHCLAFVKRVANNNGGLEKTSLFDTETTRIIKDLPESNPILCEWCEEIVVGVTCPNHHPVQCCSLTLQKIDHPDYLQCSCGLLARAELYLENPTCPVCDERFKRNDIFQPLSDIKR